jgi:hypothetical protein
MRVNLGFFVGESMMAAGARSEDTEASMCENVCSEGVAGSDLGVAGGQSDGGAFEDPLVRALRAGGVSAHLHHPRAALRLLHSPGESHGPRPHPHLPRPNRPIRQT